MALIDEMVIELQKEAEETGRVLEGVADEHLAWRPRAGAKTLGQIALQVATLPAVIAELAAVPTPAAPQPEPSSAAALVAALNHSMSIAQQLLADLDDSALLGSWRLMHGQREVFSLPRGALLRALLLDYWRAQRAELALYLRALGIGDGIDEAAEDATNPFSLPEPSGVH